MRASSKKRYCKRITETSHSVQLWRVSRYPALDGVGGLYAEGRWHTRGQPIVYCAPNSGTALIEWIVHLELSPEVIPERIPYLIVDLPDDLDLERHAAVLPEDWKANVAVTRDIGDEWLASRRTAALLVPSAVVPETINVLINPLHPDAARITVVRNFEDPFDPRLLPGRRTL